MYQAPPRARAILYYMARKRGYVGGAVEESETEHFHYW